MNITDHGRQIITPKSRLGQGNLFFQLNNTTGNIEEGEGNLRVSRNGEHLITTTGEQMKLSFDLKARELLAQ